MKTTNDYSVQQKYAHYNHASKNQMVLNAAYFGNLSMLKLWVDLGGNVNFSEKRDGWCAIHYACRWENIPMIQYLIDSGANMDKTTVDRETIFHICAIWDRTEAAQYLIDRGFYEKPFLKNGKGYTAVELAISREMKTILFY